MRINIQINRVELESPETYSCTDGAFQQVHQDKSMRENSQIVQEQFVNNNPHTKNKVDSYITLYININ